MSLGHQVSIIIPAYNQGQYLPVALESALAQTFRDFEIVVVDDGSTDDTAKIVQQFMDRDNPAKRIHYVWQSNQGLAGARNTGILQARGELVALLDSDDAWLPNYLEKMVGLANRCQEASVFYCQVLFMDSEGLKLPQVPPERVIRPEQLYHILLGTNFLVPSTILMRRSDAIRAGLFDPEFRRLQDWEFWLRLLRSGRRFVGCTDRLVRYRLHGNNLSKDPAGGRVAAMAMVTKLFGEDDGHWENWPVDKRRAFGGAYRYYALSSVQHQKDWMAGANYLRRALMLDSSMARDLDMFYELALGDQPLGFRGTQQRLSLRENAIHLEDALEEVFRPPLPKEFSALQNRTRASAYRALGLLAYNLGQLGLSRRYLTLALRKQPSLAFDRYLAIPLFKSLLGASNLERLRRLRNSLASR